MAIKYIYWKLAIMMRFIENIKSWAYLTSLYDWFGKRTYAQSGEDVIAWGELRMDCRAPLAMTKWKGFYVEVGAYHPKLFSNTYLFYKKGWRGICIEPNPRMEKLFRIARPRDVFVNYGVGDVGGVRLPRSRHGGQVARNDGNEEMEYFEFEDGAANTFSVEQARKNQEEAGRKLIGKRRIPVLPLKTILDKYLPKGQKIDLLSVDAEGMDLEVLRSNDWKKYRPEMIIAEDLGFDNNLSLRVSYSNRSNPGFSGSPRKGDPGEPRFARDDEGDGSPRFARNDKVGVVGFLDEVGYRLVAKTPYSVIFKNGFDKSNPYGGK